MKYFNEDKYKIYVDEKNRKVIAVSTYAGKAVRGVAKADPRDEYDFETGKCLAIARCNQKIAEKRAKRAANKVSLATTELAEAQMYLEKMQTYLLDANEALATSTEKLCSLLDRV